MLLVRMRHKIAIINKNYVLCQNKTWINWLMVDTVISYFKEEM